jgi:N-acetylglutamate synthase-like GNAT family acetyltransferase
METQLAVSVRRARPTDVPALADLVNKAYAIEEFFVDGDRTTRDEIERLVSSFVVLERVDSKQLAAAVYVESTSSDGGYFGMLSVDPAMQGKGLGTRLVRVAEALCEAMGATSVRLRIINLREELGRWYKSLGYQEVGTAPYTHRPVKQACHFVEMRRSLVAAS